MTNLLCQRRGIAPWRRGPSWRVFEVLAQTLQPDFCLQIETRKKKFVVSCQVRLFELNLSVSGAFSGIRRHTHRLLSSHLKVVQWVTRFVVDLKNPKLIVLTSRAH